jgi:hypothetical protein
MGMEEDLEKGFWRGGWRWIRRGELERDLGKWYGEKVGMRWIEQGVG